MTWVPNLFVTMSHFPLDESEMSHIIEHSENIARYHRQVVPAFVVLTGNTKIKGESGECPSSSPQGKTFGKVS